MIQSRTSELNLKRTSFNNSSLVEHHLSMTFCHTGSSTTTLLCELKR